jgi:uncharacterized protein YukE
VSDVIRVVPEDLHVSAANVDAHADELHLSNTSANGRIEAARVGVPTGAAAALSAAVAKWQSDTTALFGRLVEHSVGLRAGAALYENTDEQSAGEIEAVRNRITPEDMGL